MTAYLVRRLLLFIPVVFGAALFVFFVMQVLPGDVAQLILGEEGRAGSVAVEKLRAQLGLNRPLYEQFLSWLWGVLRLDLGNSLWTGRPIMDELVVRIPVSLEFVFLGVILSVIIGVPAGIVSAVKRETPFDYAVRSLAYCGQAIPNFWLGIMVIILLVTVFRWLPPVSYSSIIENPIENLLMMAAPAFVLGFRQTAVTARMTRSCMLEVLSEDFVRTARAKGLLERAVLLRHALTNALLPIITIVFMEFAYLFGALIVLEHVFNLPGMGSFIVEAIYRRDVPTVQAIILFLALVVALTNLAQDLLYGLLDPRIRYS